MIQSADWIRCTFVHETDVSRNDWFPQQPLKRHDSMVPRGFKRGLGPWCREAFSLRQPNVNIFQSDSSMSYRTNLFVVVRQYCSLVSVRPLRCVLCTMDEATWNEKLIATVKEYPVLYNHRLKEYHDRVLQDSIWSKIVLEMNEGGMWYFILSHMRWLLIKQVLNLFGRTFRASKEVEYNPRIMLPSYMNTRASGVKLLADQFYAKNGQNSRGYPLKLKDFHSYFDEDSKLTLSK